MKTRSVLLVSFVAGLSATALAADFDTIDVDQDGVITIEEAMPVGIFQDNFDRADMDSDGMIDLTEYSAFISGQDQELDIDEMNNLDEESF